MDYLDLNNSIKKECIETTFKEMGIRAEKKIAEHILKQNVYGSNLISDISTTDYTKNNNGKTNLKPIEGHDVFVDDLFIYGYLRKDDIVFNTTGGINCTTGKNGSASYIIEQIRCITNYTIGRDTPFPIHVNFMDTIKIGNNTKEGRILSTIRTIEKYINVREKWIECNNGEEPFGVFIVKIDVSNISFTTLQDNLKILQRKLLNNGNSIYSVDYTMDFSGTLNKKELIDYLLTYKNFRLEKSEDYGDYTILNNSGSAGNNTLTFIYDNYGKGKTAYRAKLYNKPVCNFEKSDVRSVIGGHISNYVCSSSERLRSLFSNKEAQERGITRLEVSVYGLHEEINKDIGENIIQEIFNIFNTEETIEEIEEPLFYICPIKQQWLNLSENIKNSLTLVDRINSIIYVILYGSTLTNTLVGTVVDFSKSKDDINLEDYVKWCISDFGPKLVPIYRVDLLSIENEKIILSPIRCYVKGEDAFTILTPCRKPLNIIKDPPNIDFYLPPTHFVNFKWRIKKEKQPKHRKPTQELIEMPNLAKSKKISTISVKERFKIQEELRELKEKGEFICKSNTIINKLYKDYFIPNVEELTLIRKELENINNLKELKQQALEVTKNSLLNNHTFYLTDIIPRKYKINGWKEILNKNGEPKIIVVLEDLEEIEENRYFNVWPNTKILKYIIAFKKFFTSSINPYFKKNIIETKENKKEYYFTFIPEIKNKFFEIEIFTTKYFYNEEGKRINYNPIKFIQDYNYKDLKEELEKIEKEHEETINKYNTTILKDVPLPEDEEKYWCREVPEGIYKVERITDTFYDKKQLIYLHIIPIENNRIETEKEKIVKGHFIEEEWRKLINKLEGEKPKHPLICRLGICKTESKSKRKFRTCVLEYEDK